MSVTECDCADDVSDDEQWQETDDCSAGQIHREKSELRSIQTLTKTTTFMTDVRQVHEQHDDDDDQNDTVHWVKLIRLWYAEI